MPSCCIKNCKTKSGISFAKNRFRLFPFPKEENVRKKWLEACQRSEKDLKINTAAICERHFAPSCLEDKLTQGRSKNKERKIIRRLHKGSIPTELLDIPNEKVPTPESPPVKKLCTGIPCYKDLLSAVKKNSIVDISNNLKQTPQNEGEAEKKVDLENKHIISTEAKKISKTSLQLLSSENKKLREYVQNLMQETEKFAKANRQLAFLNKELNNKLLRMKEISAENSKQETKIYDALSKTFTPGQIKRIMNPNRKRIQWTVEDILSAITLRSMGTKAYDYLRKKIPLPCVQVLRNWTANFNVQPGILNSVLEIMEIKGKNLCVEQKLCILSFDEIRISNKIDSEQRQQKIYGPHSTVQVAIIRGLFASWKQPIFYDYDTAMSKDILFNIISRLYKIGFIVVAIVSNLDPIDAKLWKPLNIGAAIPSARNPNEAQIAEEDKQCFIMHPSNKTLKIFIFADVPHLLKLARNHLFDSGFVIDGQVATKDILDELLALNSGNMKIAFNLTKMHLDVKNSQRQCVKLAAQVFSRRNAKAIEYYGKKGFLKKDNWQIMARLLQQFNDWFDVLNCQSKFDKHSDSRAYGLELNKQDAIINEMNKLVSKIYILKNEYKVLEIPCLRNTLFPFQKGILLTNKSLKEMFRYLKEKYSTDCCKIEYIITRKLNQDVLENLFSYIRRMGETNDYPSSIEWQHGLKSYILENYTEEESGNKNTENDKSSVDFMNIRDTSTNFSNLRRNSEETSKEDFVKEEQFLSTKLEIPEL